MNEITEDEQKLAEEMTREFKEARGQNPTARPMAPGKADFPLGIDEELLSDVEQPNAPNP